LRGTFDILNVCSVRVFAGSVVYKLLYLMNIIPACTASVERNFSYTCMNLIKTPLRSRLTQRNLEALMRISMEGKDKLSESDLDTLVNKFKNKKDKYMML
jgi:hypothetical protein